MGSFAEGERNKIIDAYVGRTTYTANAAFYAKLHLGDPGAAGTSNPAAETTRKLVTFGSAAASAAISNTAIVEWINVPNTETYTHVSFWTASSGGTFLGSDDLSSSAAMTAGQTFNIPIGDLDLTMSGDFATGELNKALDAYVGRADYTANAAYFIKLHLGDPGAAGTSNPAAETTRKQSTFGSAAASGAIANTAALEWPTYPTGETVSHVSGWTASSGGTWLGNDALPSSVVMTSGETLRIPVGDLDATVT